MVAASCEQPDYQSSVPLHTMEAVQTLRPMLRLQGPPLAIVVLGPKDPHYVGVEMKVPVLRRTPGAASAQPTHLDATVYQFGRLEVQRQ